jgi:hypothetical protein
MPVLTQSEHAGVLPSHFSCQPLIVCTCITPYISLLFSSWPDRLRSLYWVFRKTPLPNRYNGSGRLHNDDPLILSLGNPQTPVPGSLSNRAGQSKMGRFPAEFIELGVASRELKVRECMPGE